jgi:NADH:ubiquinone oxidoreductase subunit F (NADH-binding)
VPHSPATLRGVQSFFADTVHGSANGRVCRGLSCHLAKAVDTARDDAGLQPVYCLGYCDQSPVWIRPENQVVVGKAKTAPVLPSIRSLAAVPIVTARLGKGDHATLEKARAAGAYQALSAWLNEPPSERTQQKKSSSVTTNPDRRPTARSAALLDTIIRSGEQGRGGAGFLTGEKWLASASIADINKVVIANGDEGDPGSYIDRLLLENDPHAVLEGLALCAFAAGAARGIVYVRSEYPQALRRMQQAVAEATAAGILGPASADFPLAFDVEVVAGHGSYVCGEETALLNAIEGHRGEVRIRPPYPSVSGLHGHPTVVNNVETLVTIPWIAAQGAEAYRQFGSEHSPGTKAICLNHGFAHPGVVEVEFGTPLRTVIEVAGGGSSDGKPLLAVVLGGPMGSVVTPAQWDVPIDYAAMRAAGIELGHGGLIALSADTDVFAVIQHWLTFMVYESCGRCVPCRSGSREALRLAAQMTTPADRAALDQLLQMVSLGSLCAFGRNIPVPVRQLLALLR